MWNEIRIIKINKIKRRKIDLNLVIIPFTLPHDDVKILNYVGKR